jgi:predicted nucleic acid-binding protein
MADCILDTNVAIKLVLNEPDSADAERVVNDIAATNGTLFLLDVARIEAVHVIWVQFHRRLLSEPRARAAFADLEQLPFLIIDAEPLLSRAFDLALQFDIAVYDACFVAAVKGLGCLGVTADVPLVNKVGSSFPAIKLLKNW